MDPKRLFVGNLSWGTTQEALTEAFAAYGDVEEVHLVKGPDGRSRGIAFVVMGTEEAATAAIEGLNETELDGRKLIVNTARPRENRPPRDDRGPRSFHDRDNRGPRNYDQAA
jgi:RNA recognition motif-containing protein